MEPHGTRRPGREPIEASIGWGENPRSASMILKDLLNASVIADEDWEALPEQTKDELRGCSDGEALLEKLVRQGILTQYQAGRIRPGNTLDLTLGNYRVLDQLGTGGMGFFKAEHCQLRCPVALKVF